MEDVLGVITAPHGVRGEVKVFPTTDEPKRFRKLKEVIVETGTERKVMEIEGVKLFKQFVFLKLKGVDSMEDAELYRRAELYVTRRNAVRLNEDEYFIADLIGLKVIDEDGAYLGVVQDVILTGANDVYVVRMPNDEDILLPAIKQCILKIDLEEGFIRVHILEGLLD